MNELTSEMVQNGFSIAVAAFLLLKIDKRLDELTKAVCALSAAIDSKLSLTK